MLKVYSLQNIGLPVKASAGCEDLIVKVLRSQAPPIHHGLLVNAQELHRKGRRNRGRY